MDLTCSKFNVVLNMRISFIRKMAHPGSKTADILTILVISVSLKLHSDNNPVVIRPVVIVYVVTANIASVDFPHLCQTRRGHKINWWHKKVRRWSFVCPHHIRVQLHSVLMLTPDGSEWLTSCPSCFNSGRDPGRATESVWTFWRRKKNSCPYRDLTPRLFAP
jgi:hypothetical protein